MIAALQFTANKYISSTMETTLIKNIIDIYILASTKVRNVCLEIKRTLK